MKSTILVASALFLSVMASAQTDTATKAATTETVIPENLKGLTTETLRPEHAFPLWAATPPPATHRLRLPSRLMK